MEILNSKMEHVMKDIGIITYDMEEENFNMPMEIFMKVNFMKIWHKDLAFINMQTEVNMQGIGIQINNMVLERKSGMMEIHISDFTKIHRKMDKANIIIRMEINIQDNLNQIFSPEKEFSFGRMEEFTMVIGGKI